MSSAPAGRVVVCAGLQADRLAPTEHRIVPFRGDYFVPVSYTHLTLPTIYSV